MLGRRDQFTEFHLWGDKFTFARGCLISTIIRTNHVREAYQAPNQGFFFFFGWGECGCELFGDQATRAARRICRGEVPLLHVRGRTLPKKIIIFILYNSYMQIYNIRILKCVCFMWYVYRSKFMFIFNNSWYNQKTVGQVCHICW